MAVRYLTLLGDRIIISDLFHERIELLNNVTMPFIVTWAEDKSLIGKVFA